MILVIGGAGAGKREYVLSLGYRGEDISSCVSDARPVFFGAEAFAFADPGGCMEHIEKLCEKEVVVCAEVGSGVIPAERADRDRREAAGRLSIALAARAERVVRLVCGIPIVIK